LKEKPPNLQVVEIAQISFAEAEVGFGLAADGEVQRNVTWADQNPPVTFQKTVE